MLAHDLVGDLLAPLVARGAGLLLETVERIALTVEDLVELVRYVLVGAAGIVLVTFLAPAFPDPLEKFLEPFDVPATAVPETLLHHPAKTRTQRRRGT